VFSRFPDSRSLALALSLTLLLSAPARAASPAQARPSAKTGARSTATVPFFTGRPGAYVAIKDTVASFKEILEGKTDTLPEQAFFLAGTIEDVRANAERLAS